MGKLYEKTISLWKQLRDRFRREQKLEIRGSKQRIIAIGIQCIKVNTSFNLEEA
ncbi:5605_t:CDS:2, partial [Funneliformis caledonium]